jgi:hypothetical protein
VFERALATEQHLVETDRDGLADLIRVINECPAVMVHRVHHRVPITAQISHDLSHRTAVTADLERRPPTSPIRDPSTIRSDPSIGLDERDDGAVGVRAPPSRLRPDQAGSPIEARQIDEFDTNVVVAPHPTSTRRTFRPLNACADRDSQPPRPVTNAFDVDVGQTNQQFAHTRRIGLQQGLLGF